MRVSSLREWINVNLDLLPVVCSAGHSLAVSVTHAQICRENTVLSADNKLDLLHTVLSTCVKSVLEWHFLEECFICSFRNLHLLQSWVFTRLCCTCIVALHSHSFWRSNLGKSSPPLFQLKCSHTCISPPLLATVISHAHFCIIFVSFVYTFCLHLHGPVLYVWNNLPGDANHSFL